MAALIKHVLSKSRENFVKISATQVFQRSNRGYAMKRHYKQKIGKVQMPECRKLKATEDSIASRGFLRCYKDYTPPEDTCQKLENLFELHVAGIEKDEPLTDTYKFSFLNACFIEFQHSIPNSLMHTINSFNDIEKFYLTPVNTTLPLDRFKTVDLPPNLHIQYEALRFHPDDDVKFGGQTAFPKSNNLVTGLRTRKKYKGFKVVEGWPDKF